MTATTAVLLTDPTGRQIPQQYDAAADAYIPTSGPVDAALSKDVSLVVGTGGTSQKLTLAAGVSSATTALTAVSAVIYSSVDGFVRQGAAPTALVNGTDQFVPSGTLLRVSVTSGNKLAFISASNGTVYITPGA